MSQIECLGMLPGCAVAFGRIEEKLDNLTARQGDIFDLLNGNGKPGLITDVTGLKRDTQAVADRLLLADNKRSVEAKEAADQVAEQHRQGLEAIKNKSDRHFNIGLGVALALLAGVVTLIVERVLSCCK